MMGISNKACLLPYKVFLTRCEDESKNKSVYFTTEKVKEVMENNDYRVKIIKHLLVVITKELVVNTGLPRRSPCPAVIKEKLTKPGTFNSFNF